MQDIVLELQDMRYLDWALKKIAPRTLGCFLKVYEEAADQKIYYKLSNYDSCRGIFGHECVNELIASRVMKGIRRLDPEWSLRWVQSRIVPYSRQNISEILRANGMDSYEEQKLLLKNEGRNCQDEFYLAPLPPKFFVHYGSEHFDRNRFAPVRNEKDRDKPTGGLWGYPTGSEEGRNKRRREEPHFIFRLNCPYNWSVIHSREEREKYPRQPGTTVTGHTVLDYEKIARQGLGDGKPIYAIVTEFEDHETLRDYSCGDDCNSVFVLNDSILVENYDAKLTENPLTLEDLLPLRHFKTLRKGIEVSYLLRSPDGKRYIYVEEPSAHYGFRTLVSCISDGRIVEVCGYTENEAKALMAELMGYF